MADPRTQHPFWMHEEIHAQPDAVQAVLAEQDEAVARAATALRAARPRRLLFVGTGTSFHAAQCAAWFARLEGIPLTTLAVPSYDFATYPLALTSDDAVVVISHRGTKHYTGTALELARAAKVVTLLVTGRGPHEAPSGVRVLRTCHQDRSAAHTVSYASALAVLTLLLADYADDSRLRGVVLTLPKYLREAVLTEGVARELAERFADRRRIYFVGGGPHAVTAAEAALKVKETSYLVSEGFAVEQILHGPMQAVEVDDLIVAIAPSGPSTKRMTDLINAASEIGAARIVVSDGDGLNADAKIQIPAMRESLSPLMSVVSLQLFAYYSALARGKNPDCFRLDDPRYKAAGSRFQL